MKRVKGIAASPGKVIGPAHILARRTLTATSAPAADPALELEKLDLALARTEADLKLLAQKARESVGEKEAEIFEAQILFLHDPDLLQRTKKRVLQERINAAYAWQEAIRYYVEILKTLDNEYLAARVMDVEDVGQQALVWLLNQSAAPATLNAPAVIAADDLTSADTIALDRKMTLAFCTRTGSPTSHAAILSKALGIPCVVALGDAFDQIREGQTLLVDGLLGEVILDPDQAAIERYRQESLDLQTRSLEAERTAALPAITLDGRRIEVGANVGFLQDAVDAVQFGADGIGLLRTEFLFLDRNEAPGRAEQVSEYAKIFQSIGKSRPVVVRTLDIGGDKPVRYLPASHEQNPFLGARGIRLSLRNPAMFSEQLSALLIAGNGYDLRIMFPMVSMIEEIEQAREILENCRSLLEREGLPCAEQPQIGIMVEVPSAAILADKFAQHVDFFSIGTNDLTQYTMAADRTGGEVASFNDPFHPAVLTLIDQVVRAAHREGKWAGLCGEFAGDPLATALLVGIGLDELSASSRLVPELKQRIRALNAGECSDLVEKALRLSTANAVRGLLKEFETGS